MEFGLGSVYVDSGAQFVARAYNDVIREDHDDGQIFALA